MKPSIRVSLTEEEDALVATAASSLYRTREELLAACALELAGRCGFGPGAGRGGQQPPVWGPAPPERPRPISLEVAFPPPFGKAVAGAAGFLRFVGPSGLAPVSSEVLVRESALRLLSGMSSDVTARAKTLRARLGELMALLPDPTGGEGAGVTPDARGRWEVPSSGEATVFVRRTPRERPHDVRPQTPPPAEASPDEGDEEDDASSSPPNPGQNVRQRPRTGGASEPPAWRALLPPWQPEMRLLLLGGAIGLAVIVSTSIWLATHGGKAALPPPPEIALVEIEAEGEARKGRERPPDAPPPSPETQAEKARVEGLRKVAKERLSRKTSERKVQSDAHDIDLLLAEKYGRPTVGIPAVRPKERPKYAALEMLLAQAPKDARYDPYIAAAIEDVKHIHPVPPELVKAIIRRESAFNPEAVSRVGAVGLMQVMPFNAPRVGLREDELKDPEKNILGGVRLLAVLLKHYRGDVISALTAYNARPRSLFAPVPRNGETPEYVDAVLGFYQEYLGTPLREVGAPQSGPATPQ